MKPFAPFVKYFPTSCSLKMDFQIRLDNSNFPSILLSISKGALDDSRALFVLYVYQSGKENL